MKYSKSVTSLVLGLINDNKLPLEEKYYNSDNYIDYLDKEHFHHSDKGCDVIMKRTTNMLSGNRVSINKFCKTHNVVCSKTGWELGWYMNTNSRFGGRQRLKKKCQYCNKLYYTVGGNSKYCRECSIVINRNGIYTKNFRRC